MNTFSFSIHSVNSDFTVTEPWMYPQCTDSIRKAIHLRYQLLPYYYSLMYKAHCTGLPIMQPLCCAFQQDTRAYDEAESFMIGNLFVATVLEKGATDRSIYLPAGTDYYDFVTRQKYAGGQTITVPVDMDTIPMFVTGGTILPMTRTIAHNMSTDSCKDLHVLCVADQNASFTLYEDDGCTNDYKNGVYKKTNISMKVDSNITISLSSEGDYVSPVERIELDVVYPQNAPLAVLLDGQMLPHYLYDKKYEEADCGWYYNLSTKSVEIKYPSPMKDHQIFIMTNAYDLIGM